MPPFPPWEKPFGFHWVDSMGEHQFRYFATHEEAEAAAKAQAKKESDATNAYPEGQAVP